MGHSEREGNLSLFTGIVGEIAVVIATFYLFITISKVELQWGFDRHFVMLIICYCASLFIFNTVKYIRDIYRADLFIEGLIRRVISFVLLWMMVVSILGVKDIIAYPKVLFLPLLLLSMGVWGVVFRKVAIVHRRRSRERHRVIFVGSSRSLVGLYEEMEDNPLSNYKVLGYFDTDENPTFEAEYLGGLDQIENYIKNNKVSGLYCALHSNMEDAILKVVRICERNIVRFYSVPSLHNYLMRPVTIEFLGDTPLLNIRTEPLSRIDNRIIKRTFDIVMSITFLIFIFPFVFIILGSLIKLSSPGPIIFRQRRNGLGGKEFWIYKFRSMRINDKADIQQASEDDPRKTRIGDFMRRTNFDELPQFINVLLGDMSVVGPRPHMVKQTGEYSKLINSYMVRHFVKPGLTGWAQISGYRGEIRELREMRARVKYDIWYMEHWSFSLDIYIVYKTTMTMLFGSDEQAY